MATNQTNDATGTASHVSSQSNLKACTCGNQACAVREARGLAPFCQISRVTTTKRAGYSSYSEAALNLKEGQKVVAAHIPGSGSPKRFVLVAA